MREIIFLNEISVDAKMKISEIQMKINMIDNSDLTASQKKAQKLPLLKQIRALKSGSKVD